MKFATILSATTAGMLMMIGAMAYNAPTTAPAPKTPAPVAAPATKTPGWCDKPVEIRVSNRFTDQALANLLMAVEFMRGAGVDYFTLVLAKDEDMTPGHPMAGVIQVFPSSDLGPDIWGVTHLNRVDGCINAAEIDLFNAGTQTIAHEIGHALGLRHVADVGNLMHPVASNSFGLLQWQREAIR